MACISRREKCLDQGHLNPIRVPPIERTVRDRLAQLEIDVEELKMQLRAVSGSSIASTDGDGFETDPQPLPTASQTNGGYLPEQTPSLALEHLPGLENTDYDPWSTSSKSNHPLQTPTMITTAVCSDERWTEPNPNHVDIPATILPERVTKDLQIHHAFTFLVFRSQDLQLRIQMATPLFGVLSALHNGIASQTTFEQEVNFAGSHGSPYDIVNVAQLMALSSTDTTFNSTVASMVQRLILSDDEYTESIKGLHCALRQGSLYTEQGQTILGWKTFRRAIHQAQVLGLQKSRRSREESFIWWSLYSLDRTCSLRLGLPYAIVDSHCNMTYGSTTISDQDSKGAGVLMARLGYLAGRVIDHQQRKDQSEEDKLDEVAQLDQILSDSIAKISSHLNPTDAFGSVGGPLHPPLPVNGGRIRGLLSYQEIQFALFFPYMLKSIEHPQYIPHRHRCIQAARMFLNVYQQSRYSALRDHPVPMYKSFDLVACAATLTLMMGLLLSQGLQREIGTR